MRKKYISPYGVEQYFPPMDIVNKDGNHIYSPSVSQLEANGWTVINESYSEPTPEDYIHQEKQNRIYELKGLLQNSDYKAIKFAEGEMSAEEYEPTRIQRREWRKEINAIESELTKEGK